MCKIFAIDTDKRPLNPIHSAQARQLLRNGKAAIFRRFPFTIILKESRPEPPVSPLRLKIDPGAKTTGIALVNDASGEVVFAAELKHRGFAIRDALTSRRQLRRSRRNRKTRYRQPRFFNRTRPQGWLAPSLQSRIKNIKTWVQKLRKLAPIAAISQELVRLSIAANGHGTRQSCRTDKFGFPNRHCSRTKLHFGFQTGDLVKAVVKTGKKVGEYVGRIATRASGSFNISTTHGLVQGISHRFCQRIHAKDGYSYVY